jgi:hypothetical protein
MYGAEMEGFRLPSVAECCALQAHFESLHASGYEPDQEAPAWTTGRRGSVATGTNPTMEFAHPWDRRILVSEIGQRAPNAFGESVLRPQLSERDGRAISPPSTLRAVRSLKPRLRAEDFATSIPELTTSIGTPLKLSANH